ASLAAEWDAARLDLARRLALILEARARARRTATLAWTPAADSAARSAVNALAEPTASARPHGVLIASDRVFAVSQALAAAGVGGVAVTHPAYLFEATSEAVERLAIAVLRRH